jgi:hypothetical protein
MSNGTMAEVRSETQPSHVSEDHLTTSAPSGPASAPQPQCTPDRGRSRPTATQRKTRSRSTSVLLSLAGVLAAALYVGSLLVLSDAAAAANERESWGGPAALSAMIAMYAVIAAFVLLFTAAFRSTDKT